MSRYVPSPEERAAIDLLRLAGYAVVRQRTYDNLGERVRVAEVMYAYEKDCSEGTRRWADKAFDEQRRLSDRLNEVCFTAASQGVTIQAINDALEKIK